MSPEWVGGRLAGDGGRDTGELAVFSLRGGAAGQGWTCGGAAGGSRVSGSRAQQGIGVGVSPVEETPPMAERIGDGCRVFFHTCSECESRMRDKTMRTEVTSCMYPPSKKMSVRPKRPVPT